MPGKSAVGLYLLNIEVDSCSLDLLCIVRVYASVATGNAMVSQRGLLLLLFKWIWWNFFSPVLGIKPRILSGLNM